MRSCTSCPRVCPFTDQLNDQQPWNHATITISKITEIVVSTHLAAINGVFRTHAFFNESMTGFSTSRVRPGTGDHIDGVPTQAWIVDYLRARLFSARGLRQQADDIIALNEIAFSSNRKQRSNRRRTQCPYQRHALAPHRRYPHDTQAAVDLECRWERAVRLVMHLDKLQRHPPRLQLRFNSIDHMPTSTVARVDH